MELSDDITTVIWNPVTACDDAIRISGARSFSPCLAARQNLMEAG
jgi:hypothetical protein